MWAARFIEYALVASVSTLALVRFQGSVRDEPAFQIQLEPPRGYLLTCEGFKQYTLPEASCAVLDNVLYLAGPQCVQRRMF